MVEQYKVLYDYQATTDNGLSLRQGEVIFVHEKGTTGWWNGEGSLGSGWFPESYVQKMEGLPSGWQALRDDQGRTYYYNSQTNETSWTIPVEAVSSAAVSAPQGGIAHSTSQTALVESSPSSGQLQAAVVEEGRTLVKDANGRINYTDNFWTDTPTGSGFDILVLKHRNGKDSMKDIAEWMRERAAVEERYAKDLIKLAKSTLGDVEEGTMKTAWYQVKFDLENQSRIRNTLAQSIIERVDKPIMEFKDKQKKTRKDFEATIAKDRKVMTGKEQEVAKSRKAYDQAMKDAEASEAVVARGPNDSNKGQFSKMEDKAKNDRKKATQAGIDYKKTVDDYLKVRQQWEDDMSLACLDFSEAEEERVAYLKKVLENYLDVELQARAKSTESAEMVRSSVQAVNAEVDIEMFVKSKGTGSRRPPVLQFEQYNPKK